MRIEYPAGKTAEVTDAYRAAGGRYWRAYSERRSPKSGDYQRVKLYGDVNMKAAQKAFKDAGFVNFRDTSWGYAADYPLPSTPVL